MDSHFYFGIILFKLPLNPLNDIQSLFEEKSIKKYDGRIH